jgi:hypothetical protein
LIRERKEREGTQQLLRARDTREEGKGREQAKDHYQALFWVLIDLIVELLGLIIKPFDNQTET